MKRVIWLSIILIFLMLIGWADFAYLSSQVENLQEEIILQPTISNMKITSAAFENNQMIPAKYTCDGQDVNPSLAISGAPAGAQSLVLIVDDPDAPTGTWHHWIVYNISPETTSIEENSVPDGAIEIKNDFGKANYGGPCPGQGSHRYFFKIFALDTKLDLPANSKLKDLEEKMHGHILDQGQLIGLYQKK